MVLYCPKLLYHACQIYGILDFSFNREVIEPLSREESRAIFKEHMEIDIEDAYAVHLFNYRLLSEGVDKNGVFPENSLFEKLKRKYL